MNLNELLRSVQDAYATRTVYRDRGAVLVDGRDSGTFETRLVRRSELFTFVFTDREQCVYKVAAEHGAITDVLLPPAFPRRFTRQSDVGLALALITGVTFRVAQVIPRLLMPERVPGRALVDCRTPRVIGEENIDGEHCYRVELGTDWPGTNVAIGATTLLVREYSTTEPTQIIQYTPVSSTE